MRKMNAGLVKVTIKYRRHSVDPVTILEIIAEYEQSPWFISRDRGFAYQQEVECNMEWVLHIS